MKAQPRARLEGLHLQGVRTQVTFCSMIRQRSPAFSSLEQRTAASLRPDPHWVPASATGTLPSGLLKSCTRTRSDGKTVQRFRLKSTFKTPFNQFKFRPTFGAIFCRPYISRTSSLAPSRGTGVGMPGQARRCRRPWGRDRCRARGPLPPASGIRSHARAPPTAPAPGPQAVFSAGVLRRRVPDSRVWQQLSVAAATSKRGDLLAVRPGGIPRQCRDPTDAHAVHGIRRPHVGLGGARSCDHSSGPGCGGGRAARLLCRPESCHQCGRVAVHTAVARSDRRCHLGWGSVDGGACHDQAHAVRRTSAYRTVLGHAWGTA